jgi:hypothetical protein
MRVDVIRIAAANANSHLLRTSAVGVNSVGLGEPKTWNNDLVRVRGVRERRKHPIPET